MKKTIILILMVMFVIGSLFADDKKEANAYDTSGPAIEIGYGNAYAGYGIMAEFFFQGNLIKSSIFVGAGYFPSISISDESISGAVETEASGGTVIGSRLYIGNRHRLVIEATYGFIGVQAAWLYMDGDTSFVQEDLIGPSLSIGYQYMGPDGGIFIITIGNSAADTDYFGELSLPTFNLGFGQKF